MDESYFGIKRRPQYRRTPRRAPRRSPRRSPTMCAKKLSLAKLRKLALENGVNIYSEARPGTYKTGRPKKPKMVGCSTLKKRLKNAGLSYLYARQVKDQSGNVLQSMSQEDYDRQAQEIIDNIRQQGIFEESLPTQQVGPTQQLNVPTQKLNVPLSQQEQKCKGDQRKNKKGECVDIRQLMLEECTGDDLLWDRTLKTCTKKNFGDTFRGLVGMKDETRQQIKKPEEPALIDFDKPDKKPLIPGQSLTAEGDSVLDFGRYERGGARPKLTYKHVGNIVVNGRAHHVFKGPNGGLFYLKGKTGKKVYIEKQRLKKTSPKRRRRR